MAWLQTLREWLRKRREWLAATLPPLIDVLSIIRVPIFITVLVCGFLALPAQTLENYRVVVQDMWMKYAFDCGGSLTLGMETCKRFDLVREALFSVLGVVGVGAAIWFVTMRLLASSQLPVAARSGLPLTAVEWAPKVLVATLLLAAAAGLYSAIPYRLDEPGSNELLDVAKRNLAIKIGQAPSTDDDLQVMRRVAEKLTHFTGMLSSGAALLAVLSLLSLIFLPKLQILKAAPSRPFWRTVEAAAALSLGLLVAFLFFPVSLPQFLGSVPILSLMAICLTFLLAQLSLWADRSGIPFMTILVIWVAVLSFLGVNNNHNIRSNYPGAQSAQTAPALKQQLQLWYASRTDAQRYQDKSKPYPVYVVAAQGGGIYAAYHSARLLASLQDRCPTFGHHLFAISGVSGGSVGASLFAALRLTQNEPINGADAPACQPGTVSTRKLLFGKNSLASAVKETLDKDMLSPLLAGMFFPDFLQWLLPFPVYPFDRSRWLEYSFEFALKSTLEQFARTKGGQWSGAENYFSRPYREHWRPDGPAPALLLNTTQVDSGERRIISPFVFGKRESQFLPVWSDGDLGTMSLGTAAILSARFPWMTPSAFFNEENANVRLVDGGYYDNSGVATAVELRDAIEVAANELGLSGKLDVKLIVLTSDPLPNRLTNRFSELLDPVRTMLHSWRARSLNTIEQARERLNPSESAMPVMRIVRLQELLYPLPLGWRLAAGTMYLVDTQDPVPDGCVGKQPAKPDTRSFDADCLLRDVEADLL